MKRHPWLLPVTLAAWTIVAPVEVRAQDSQVPAINTTAHVRLWIAAPHGIGTLRVSLKSDGHRAAAHEIGGGAAGYQFSNYIDVPAGHGTFETFSGQDKRASGSLPADLAPGAFVTLLLSDPEKTGGSPRLALVDDGSTANASAQIAVRNFVGDLKGMKVVIGDSLNAQFVPGTGFLVMHGIKPAVYQIHTSGTTPDGKPFEWTNEADLRQNPRQTLLVYPDPYGRIRPRLSVDGKNAEEPVQNQEGQR